MEIKLKSSTYCINPRRIIYVEHFIAEEAYPYSNKRKFSPDTPEEEFEKCGFPSRFSNHIVIQMTDDEKIEFLTDNEDLYDEIKSKLEKIVGG